MKSIFDTFAELINERAATAFEFKYDRPILSDKNAPRTHKAGAVFKDLFRLARFPIEKAQQRYFVYLTDREMADYFRNPQNRLLSFFDLPENESLSLTAPFVKAQAETFQSVIGDWFIPCQVICSYRQNLLNQQYALRIYKVEN